MAVDVRVALRERMECHLGDFEPGSGNVLRRTRGELEPPDRQRVGGGSDGNVEIETTLQLAERFSILRPNAGCGAKLEMLVCGAVRAMDLDLAGTPAFVAFHFIMNEHRLARLQGGDGRPF